MCKLTVWQTKRHTNRIDLRAPFSKNIKMFGHTYRQVNRYYISVNYRFEACNRNIKSITFELLKVALSFKRRNTRFYKVWTIMKHTVLVALYMTNSNLTKRRVEPRLIRVEQCLIKWVALNPRNNFDAQWCNEWNNKLI